MTNALNGFWDGIVVDVKAPATEPPGSVKVRIFDLHGSVSDPDPGVPDADLPWAWPNFMFAGPNCGLIGVPPVNSIVNILFKHGDRRYPMWIGGGHRTTPPDMPTDFTSAKQGLEPKGWMWITPGGYSLVINEMAKTIEIKTPAPAASQILIDLTTKKVEVTSNSTGSSAYQLVLDETLRRASLLTPTGQSLILDETAHSVSLRTATGQSLILDETAGEAKLTGTTKAILTAALVELGLGAAQAAVLGTAFMTLFNTHTHMYFPGPLAQAPTAPPTVPMMPGVHLSATIKVRA